MSILQGFWSYVHKDDEAEGGRISRLARDVADQFELLTGEPLTLFLDKDAIEWGDNWRDKIDQSLASIAFFIPVVTPRYFRSSECRRELHYFAKRATDLGIKDLVLPLLYVDFPALHEDPSKDDLIVLTRTFHWEKWQTLRLAEPESAEYRTGVAGLATRLVEANRQVESASLRGAATPGLQASASSPISEPPESPGTLDLLATGEEALPKWGETLNAIGEQITLIGKMMTEATGEIQRSEKVAKGFGARLLIARKLANQLTEPVEKIGALGNEYTSLMHDVDAGIRLLIERAPIEIAEKPENKEAFCSLFAAIQTMSASAIEGLSSVQHMIDVLAPVEKLSRDLRPTLRRLRDGLVVLLEGQEVVTEWVRLIEQSNVNCNQ